MSRISTTAPVRQRHPREKDRKYLDSFRDTPCEACGKNDSTTVPAHLRRGMEGGTGYKPEDALVAGLCMECHDIADRHQNRGLSEVWLPVLKKLMRERYAAWLQEGR